MTSPRLLQRWSQTLPLTSTIETIAIVVENQAGGPAPTSPLHSPQALFGGCWMSSTRHANHNRATNDSLATGPTALTGSWVSVGPVLGRSPSASRVLKLLGGRGELKRYPLAPRAFQCNGESEGGRERGVSGSSQNLYKSRGSCRTCMAHLPPNKTSFIPGQGWSSCQSRGSQGVCGGTPQTQ